MQNIKMETWQDLSLAEAYENFELDCKINNLSKETMKYYYESLKFFGEFFDLDNSCRKVSLEVVNRV